MQKKLIALAIASAISAPAFADTTVYGIVDAAVANLSATGQKSDTQVLSGGLSTSRVGFKNVSDIDGGMKAVVVLEYGLNTAQNNGAATGAAASTSGVGTARQQMVALAGDFGTVAAGYLQTTGYDFQNSYDPTSGSTISPLGNVTKGGNFLIGSVAIAARASRALAYISPKLGGTTTLAVNYTTALNNGLGNLTQASGNADAKNTAYLLSANYADGAAAAGFVYAKATLNAPATAGVTALAAATTADSNEYALGGSYDFGVAKAFGTYQSNKLTVNGVTGNATKAYSLGAAIPAGPGAVVLSYAANKMNPTAAGLATSASGETIGYVQDLSKTVTAYGAYTRMGQDIGAGGATGYSVANNVLQAASMSAGASSRMIAAGLRVKF